jgi:hypothetical protein
MRLCGRVTQFCMLVLRVGAVSEGKQRGETREAHSEQQSILTYLTRSSQKTRPELDQSFPFTEVCHSHPTLTT